MAGYTSEENQSEDQNLSLTERGNESLIVSQRQSIAGAAVGAAVVLRKSQHDELLGDRPPVSNNSTEGTNLKDLAIDSPFEQAQPTDLSNQLK